VIVLAAVVPAMGLMLLLGMAQLEARLLRPERGGDPPPGDGTAPLPPRPPVIQRPAQPKAYAGGQLADNPAWAEAVWTLPTRSP
jgi:hypothetical protein